MNTDDSQTLRSFVRAASKTHPHIQCARISDTLGGLHMLQMTKEYCQSSEYQVKTLVSCIGRQPDTDVWVFNPHVQIDKLGCEMQRHKFFW